MTSLTVRLLVTSLTFCVGVVAVGGCFLFREPRQANFATQPVGAERPHSGGGTPQPRWGEVFYPYLAQHTTLVNLPELRSTALRQGDLEVRVWFGFGLTPLEGFILKRAGGQWSALHLVGDDYYEPKKVIRKELRPPQSGWEASWERLEDAEVRTLPDSSEIDYDAGGKDGWGYLVEVREGDSYRAYHYQFPELSRRTEAKRVLEIGDTIGNEFQLRSFNAKKVPDR